MPVLLQKQDYNFLNQVPSAAVAVTSRVTTINLSQIYLINVYYYYFTTCTSDYRIALEVSKGQL